MKQSILTAVSRILVAWTFLGVLTAQESGHSLQGAMLVIRNVNVVPMDSERVLENHTVLIRDGLIIGILREDGWKFPSGTTVIDGTGKYLIPGLFDMHVHLNEEDADELMWLYLASGVLTVQSMHGGPHQLLQRSRAASGELRSPRIFTTGPTTATERVHTVAQAIATVAQQQAAGFDGIKMYGDGSDGMPRETYHALISEARKAGIRVVGHAPRNLPFSVVLQERQHSIDHMEEIVYTDESLGERLGPYVQLQFGVKKFADHPQLMLDLPDFAAELTVEIDVLALEVRASGMAVTPTLSTFGVIQSIVDESYFDLLQADSCRYIHPIVLARLQPEEVRFRNGLWKDQLEFMAKYLNQVLRLQIEMTGRFHRAGVPIMAGTDSPFTFLCQGEALHRELELLVKAGLTPFEALGAATIVPAKFLRCMDNSGTLAVGKRADVVLVAGNPLIDVGNAARVLGIALRGEWISSEVLQSKLDGIAEQHRRLEARLLPITKSIRLGDVWKTAELYRELNDHDAQLADLVESSINSQGYAKLTDLRREDALKIFQLNTKLFPLAYNTWDSLGEVHMIREDYDQAIAGYERSLELNPKNNNARNMLATIAKRRSAR